MLNRYSPEAGTIRNAVLRAIFKPSDKDND
jgi:hypothetical protein